MPWARPGSGFTAAFEALALTLCRDLPVRQAAALLRCTDKQRWRRSAHYAGQARALEKFDGVRVVGIDETSLRRGQCDITVVVHDLAAKRLLFVAEGRSHQTVRDFVDDLKAHGGNPAQVPHVCLDMSAAYALGAGKALPQAKISYNRFHVIATAMEAMDQVRRQQMAEQPGQVRQALRGHVPQALRQLRWSMRRNAASWSRLQTARGPGLEDLRQLHRQRHRALARQVTMSCLALAALDRKRASNQSPWMKPNVTDQASQAS